MPSRLEHAALRARLADARLMLLFTPALLRGADPWAILDAVACEVDVIQVRPKPIDGTGTAVTEARGTLELARGILERLRSRPEPHPLVLVNDRVDVARALEEEGLAGVHLGQTDASVAHARLVLGARPLVGLSTHDPEQVARAEELEVDYLGFGPVFATSTKGYEKGLGPERAWVASRGSSRPVFAIGGIDLTNASTLAEVGRIAVGSAILCASDPGRAARELRALIERA
jgi:thiamine-phosphate pyrophosphorylase